MRIIVFAALLALAGCHRAVGDDGSNASADAHHLDAIKTSDHAREMGANASAPSH
jgi:hypothetical protein